MDLLNFVLALVGLIRKNLTYKLRLNGGAKGSKIELFWEGFGLIITLNKIS